ncbi:MAG TPA: NAD(P)-binding domain-containing protein [Candidatus Saccharimonadales bacterium]
MPSRSIGILGAGKLGITLAQLAIKAGYTVYIAGSESPEKIALSIEVLVPGAVVLTKEEVADRATIIILALPLGKYKSVPKEHLTGKLVIDAMNYWWEVDGLRDDLTDPRTSSSETVQAHLADSRVVKAFNHMGYHDLFDETRPESTPGRKAIAIAGDRAEDIKIVSSLVNAFGFDPLVIGNLASGIRLEPGSEAFGADEEIGTLRSIVSRFPTTEKGMEVARIRGNPSY